MLFNIAKYINRAIVVLFIAIVLLRIIYEIIQL